MRVPATVADQILDQIRPMLDAGVVQLTRSGGHGVSAETTSHEVYGFVQSPWPFPPGPKKFRIKSALVDFTDSLCDLLSDATKQDWPGSDRAITVTTSRDRASISVTSTGATLVFDVDTSQWESS
jgi:hypothetical protein